MKYAVFPRTPSTATLPGKDASENYLRERLVETLAAGPVALDFFIQVQTDARQMTIEDPRKLWATAVSP